MMKLLVEGHCNIEFARTWLYKFQRTENGVRKDACPHCCGLLDGRSSFLQGYCMSEKDYEPFNESGTMCPPSPEMIEEQISWDETAECPHGIGFYEECELCTPYGGEVPDILNCADFTKPNP